MKGAASGKGKGAATASMLETVADTIDKAVQKNSD
jgi:hypothetical protein